MTLTSNSLALSPHELYEVLRYVDPKFLGYGSPTDTTRETEAMGFIDLHVRPVDPDTLYWFATLTEKGEHKLSVLKKQFESPRLVSPDIGRMSTSSTQSGAEAPPSSKATSPKSSKGRKS